jgi:predicted CopG family antitoxin
MKTINETFTDKEFNKLQAVKGKKSWHDFIMELATNEKQTQNVKTKEAQK